MATQVKSSVRLVDGALERLTALATKGVPPARMAREVEIIIGEWDVLLRADPTAAKGHALELLDQLEAGVVDAEEQVADVDRSDDAAVKQANATLAALLATRDAARRAVDGL